MDEPLPPPAPTPVMPDPTLPPAPPGAGEFASTFVVGGVLVFIAFVLVMVFFLRSMSKQQELRKAAPPPELPKVGIEAGWYPTPDDTQERYHDGQEWTSQFRPRVEETAETPPAERSEP